MIEAICYASEHGGSLLRHTGGFWSDSMWQNGREYWGTRTIEGLVRRGYMTYSKWKENAYGKFPIEATLTEKATT